MKLFKITYLFTFAVLMLFTSCEKVITLDLKNAEPALVIEGYLSDQNEIQTVKISKTYPFTEANKLNGVSGAQVVLTTENSNVTFPETSTPGIYQSMPFAGTPGIKYTLEITFEGKTYTANSTIPPKVPIDLLGIKKLSLFEGEKTYPLITYQDPPGIQNQYRYLLKVKNKDITFDSVDEDRFNDGNKVENVLFYALDDLTDGDEVEIEFQSLDRNVFKYFFAIKQIDGEGGPPVAPANPVSNFNNGALGIFSAYSSDKKTLVKQ